MVVGARQLRRYYEEQGAAALSKARKLLAAGGVPYAARILVGEVAETIERQARHARCGAIVIGTRGMTAAANLVLGSIATKVLHAATRPVVLVK
jgi:nucleotide-binding universal stress UspA family protein